MSLDGEREKLFKYLQNCSREKWFGVGDGVGQDKTCQLKFNLEN